MRKRLAGGLLGSLALSVALAGAVAAAPGGNKAGDTLVNVQVSNLAVLVPVAVAANLCDINVNILAAQADLGGATCEADAESAASPGWNSGGGNQAGNSLINVQLDNVTVAVPIALALNICDLDVNVLARQFAAGGTSCIADAIATAN
jgi:hypothetical protein